MNNKPIITIIIGILLLTVLISNAQATTYFSYNQESESNYRNYDRWSYIEDTKGTKRGFILTHEWTEPKNEITISIESSSRSTSTSGIGWGYYGTTYSYDDEEAVSNNIKTLVGRNNAVATAFNQESRNTHVTVKNAMNIYQRSNLYGSYGYGSYGTYGYSGYDGTNKYYYRDLDTAFWH